MGDSTSGAIAHEIMCDLFLFFSLDLSLGRYNIVADGLRDAAVSPDSSQVPRVIVVIAARLVDGDSRDTTDE